MKATPVIRWKLRALMADRKMKATKLAELLGVNRVTVSGWVSSNDVPAFREPTKILNELCKHLECQPGELITYQPDEE